MLDSWHGVTLQCCRRVRELEDQSHSLTNNLRSLELYEEKVRLPYTPFLTTFTITKCNLSNPLPKSEAWLLFFFFFFYPFFSHSFVLVVCLVVSTCAGFMGVVALLSCVFWYIFVFGLPHQHRPCLRSPPFLFLFPVTCKKTHLSVKASAGVLCESGCDRWKSR